MSKPVQAQFEFTAHQNHFLFSDHYLNDLLKRTDAWRNIADNARTFRAWLRELYEKEKDQLADYSETQLENHWFRPILDKLGHVYEGQAVVPGLKTEIKKPDFVLFPDEISRQTAVSSQNTAAYAQNALGIVEVKKWHINLSKKARGGGPGFADNNPMYQIDYYLRATDRDWGIVSNGKQWRLVHKESSYKLDIYFELDIEAALHQPDDDSTATATFAFFLLFFRQAALRPDATGRHFLNQTLQSSKTYAHALETDLAENAYKALEQLITGFFAPDRNQLDPNNPHHLRRVYDNSLYLLYRILFLLYGESRGLLPMGNDQYRERSLRTLTKSITLIADTGKMRTIPPITAQYWDRLQRLFAIINGTDPQTNEWLGVPRYNGGLFNPEQHPFLETHFVGDQHLARAIDYLARRISSDNTKELVDYRTLGVRQLGSIYEGLLEYQPRMAAEPMIAIRQKGADKWLPASKKGRTKVLERRDIGELYLATDKGERKATGSYYTPDYIVKYIVENTLTPLIETAQADASSASSDADRAQQFTEAVFALNVLDPAMGSGHFLVEATDFLAAALATNEWIQTPDLPDRLPQSDEADLVYWRRRVVEACIYGVDKNQLAVELAKLSLWLVTAAADRPLSFLDHHLRHGDSLIGARLDDLHRLSQKKRSRKRKPTATTGVEASAGAEQPSLFSTSALERTMFQAVGGFMQIETLLSDDIESVHLKEQIFEQLQSTHLARWRRLADLWTSSFFGNAMSPEEYADLSRRVLGTGSSSLSDEQAARFLDHPTVTDNDYFHWELAFPEVFFDQNGNPQYDAAGFDAVIGNPPYEELSENERGSTILEIPFLNNIKHFAPAMGNRINLYRVFITQSMILTRKSGGWHSFIVPMSLLADQFTFSLRKHILEKVWVNKLELFPQKDDPNDRVFIDAKLSTCLYIIKQESPENHDTFVRTHPGRKIEEKSPHYEALQTQFFQFDKENYSIPGIHSQAWNLVLRLADMCKIGDYASASPGELMINRSIRPYLTTKNNGEEIMRGSHISLYQLVEPKQGESLYLNREKYLSKHKNSKKAQHHKESRVVYQRYAAIDNYRRLIATLLPAGHFCSHTTGYFVDISTVSQKFLLALMNSHLLDWRFNITSTNNNINGYEVEALPIPLIEFSTGENQRTAVYTNAKTHYEQDNTTAVLNWTAAELAANRNDTIHDLLAHLAEQMIAMHKEKQTLTQRFFTDLEGMMDDPKQFATLHNKGKQAATLHKKAAAAQPFVNADSRRSLPLTDSLGWNEAAFKGFVKLLLGKVRRLSDLVAVYQDYAPDYRTLTQRIHTTDDLIDQIVYKLYGLTDEEIGIVEGS